MPASSTLLRAVGGHRGPDFSKGGRGPLIPLKRPERKRRQEMAAVGIGDALDVIWER